MFRPKTFDEFIGNENIKERLQMYMAVCKKENKILPHIIFYGGAGLGKTTLANIVANEWGGELISITGSSLRTMEDLSSLMCGIKKIQKDHDVFLMIDEIHELPKSTLPEAVWLPLIENFTLFFSVTPATSTTHTKALNIKTDPFTLLGATTNPEDLSKPLRDRFPIICQMQPYTAKEMAIIISQCAAKEHTTIEKRALVGMVKRTRGNPRLANSMFDLTLLRAKSKGEKTITYKTFREEMKSQKIDNLGLTDRDREVLDILVHNHRPMGATRIANIMLIKTKSLLEMHEYYLVRLGLLQVDSKGRVITTRGKMHLRHYYY